jgi:hypothetical protein
MFRVMYRGTDQNSFSLTRFRSKIERPENKHDIVRDTLHGMYHKMIREMYRLLKNF